MDKNLAIKVTLIIVLVIAGIFLLLAGAVSTIYIGGKVRMWILRRDMTGGTNLVYEVDASGLSEEEKKDLSRRMIDVLRRRIDPANIQNLIWRPQGNTRFEIQIPPAAGPRAPQDIQRMLKGAGILEFRVLPTQGHPEVDTDGVARCVKSLQEKGPKYATDNKFVWCEIEELREWIVRDEQGQPLVKVSDKQERPCIVGAFGDKYYVLASNKPDETMLHGPTEKKWKLLRAQPGTESWTGRRAINFVLDQLGGNMFGIVSGKNIDRPLCILLDGMAISAPMINTKITTHGQITGSFTATEVADIVNKLNAGRLPARLIEQPISVKTIGPPIPAGKPDKSTGIEGNMSKDKS